MGWSLIIHGGAGDIPAGQRDACRAGARVALLAGAAVLEGGGSAVAAVEAAIRAMEDDPVFNAGFGAVPNSDGEVEMDAAIMDGGSFDIGGVGAIRGVRHPVSVAGAMLRDVPILLVGEGARRYAAEHGAELCDPRDLLATRPAVGAAAHDTVGCVARDGGGNIAAGNSTGGLAGKLPGRIGDSPLPGAGLYADSRVGGVAWSGEGERIARMTLASEVMQRMTRGAPQSAVEGALARLGATVGGIAGAIALDRRGRIGWAHDSACFTVGIAAERVPPRVYLRKDEEAAAP
jgi:beta-aspartyl-peptidase (threonine type)